MIHWTILLLQIETLRIYNIKPWLDCVWIESNIFDVEMIVKKHQTRNKCNVNRCVTVPSFFWELDALNNLFFYISWVTKHLVFSWSYVSDSFIPAHLCNSCIWPGRDQMRCLYSLSSFGKNWWSKPVPFLVRKVSNV